MEVNLKPDFGPEIEKRSDQIPHKIIDDPGSCIVKDQSDVKIIKLLWICSNGEQKLITFSQPSGNCTVQDLLDEAGIPMCEDSSISLITDPLIEFNYVVNSALFSNDGTTKTDSSLDESCGNFEMNENKEDEKRNKEQKEMLELKRELSGPSKTRRIRNRCRGEKEVFENLAHIVGISSDEEDQREVERSKKSGVKSNSSMLTNVKNTHDEIKNKTISNEESIITNNNSVDSLSELHADHKGSIKGDEVLHKVQNMLIDSSIEAPYTSLICRIIMIGSHVYTPEERVIISRGGMTLRAPLIADDTNFVLLRIEFYDIVRVVPHFAEPIPVLFFYIRLNVVHKIRKSLNMEDPKGTYYDPFSGDQTQRRLIFVLKEISKESVLVLTNLFSAKNKRLEEFNSTEAEYLLLLSSPENIRPQIQKLIKKSKRVSSTVNNTVKDEVKTGAKRAQSTKQISKETRTTVNSIVKDEIKPILGEARSFIQISDEPRLTPDNTLNKKIKLAVKQSEGSVKRSEELISIVNNPVHDKNEILLVYPPPPARGGIPITVQDYGCLRETHFLNDIIIDFYLRYLTLEVLSQKDRDKTHTFSTHFYKRLTSPAADNNTQISPARQRHTNVQKWTKNVNIFQKDFIIIPINEHAHWFVAIICFPNLVGKACGEKQTRYNMRKAKEMKLQVTTNQDHQIASKRRPCILIFDSLAGSGSSVTSVIANLQDYLTYEHTAKIGTEVIFSEETMKGGCPKVPQQRNYSDCGIYLLQYVECFFSDPITDYNLPIKSLEKWFEKVDVNRKRKELANLIMKLRERL